MRADPPPEERHLRASGKNALRLHGMPKIISTESSRAAKSRVRRVRFPGHAIAHLDPCFRQICRTSECLELFYGWGPHSMLKSIPLYAGPAGPHWRAVSTTAGRRSTTIPPSAARRGVAIGRKNYLDAGGRHAAGIYLLIDQRAAAAERGVPSSRRRTRRRHKPGAGIPSVRVAGCR
jgi:hypothetical protein